LIIVIRHLIGMLASLAVALFRLLLLLQSLARLLFTRRLSLLLLWPDSVRVDLELRM
jgi:hypothetical protein